MSISADMPGDENPSARRITVRSIDADEIGTLRDDLSRVLIKCVEAGASVSFMQPMTMTKAAVFWDHVRADAAAGNRVVIVAEMSGRLVGTAQLVFGLPENQPHRADVAKVLVRPDARRLGVGRALMTAIEREAVRIGRTLLVLDTVTGRAGDGLYRSLAWQEAGTIPNYALLPEGGLCSTTFFYKNLIPD